MHDCQRDSHTTSQTAIYTNIMQTDIRVLLLVLGRFGWFCWFWRWFWLVLGRFGWFWVVLGGSVFQVTKSCNCKLLTRLMLNCKSVLNLMG